MPPQPNDSIRGLTLTQPWASLVALGHKTCETRSWFTYYRCDLAIHAAKTFPPDAQLFARRCYRDGLLKVGPDELPRGAILCVVRLTCCESTHITRARPDFTDQERQLGNFDDGRWAWWLQNLRKLSIMQECKGSLGLWALPDFTRRRIELDLSTPSNPPRHFDK